MEILFRDQALILSSISVRLLLFFYMKCNNNYNVYAYENAA
jgi:hypothetical protein